jgi:trimeric autotransporter adhesin
MAYQPKSYRKFVATTATAAMVASAVAPVVSAAAGFTDVAPQYKDAIDFLVSTGATNGKTDTKFGVYDEITRLDAAVILAKVLKLDVDNAKDAGFTDVPKDRAKYVNALVEAGVLSGKAPGKFGAYDKLTRVEMAKIIANAYNLKGDDVTLPFTDVNDTWAPYVKALYKYEVTKGKTETSFGAYQNITRGDFAVFVYRAANVDVAPQVVSVSAINSKTLEVKFNKAVDDTKAKFEVKRGSITANISKVTWSEDKKAVQLELASKLFAGDYTVNVTGLTDQALTGTVKVENEKVAKIEILSDNAILASGPSPTSVSVGYKVYNQYGEDITSKTTLSATSSTGTAVVDSSKGIVTISGLTSPKVGDKVSLTLVHADTATAVSKTLTISESSKVSEVKITGLYNPDGKELSEDTRDNDFYLLVDAKDQYGNDLTASDLNASSVAVSSSNTLVANATAGDFKELTIDGKKRIGLKLDTSAATAGKTTISIITLSNAKVAQYEVEVKEAAKVDTFVLAQPELAVAGEKVNIPFEAYDKQGNKVTKKELLDLVSVKANGAGLTNVSVPFEKDAKTGEVKLSLDLSGATPTGGKVTLTAITPTNKVATLVLDVKEKAKPVYVAGLKDIDGNVKAGSSVKLTLDNLIVKDQYDREYDITNDLGTSPEDYEVHISVNDGTIANFGGSPTPATTAVIDDSSDIVTLYGAAKGNTLLKFELYKYPASGSATPVNGSEFEKSIRVADPSEFTSYEVAPIGTVYDDSNSDLAVANDAYKRPVKVYGVLSNGTKVLLDSSDYTVRFEGQSGLEAAIDPVSRTWKINVRANGTTPSTISYATGATEAQAKVIVTINATGERLEKDVTISKAAPKVAVAKFDSAKVTEGVHVLPTTATSLSASDMVGLLDASEVKDQYDEPVTVISDATGVTFADGSTQGLNFTVSNIFDAAPTGLFIDDNGTNTVAVSSIGAGDSFKLTYEFAGGYTIAVKVQK